MFFHEERSRGFCGRGGTVERVTDFFQKKIGTSVTRSDEVVEMRGTIEAYFSIMYSDNKVLKMPLLSLFLVFLDF